MLDFLTFILIIRDKDNIVNTRGGDYLAKADIKMPDEFLDRITGLGAREDAIAEKVLEAGAAVVASKVRSNLISVISKNTVVESRSTGELLSALGTTKVRVNRDGNHDIKIGFAEPRKDGERIFEFTNLFHGQRFPIVFDKDPDYTYTGRIDVSAITKHDAYTEV